MNYIFKHKKISKYGNEIERTTNVSADSLATAKRVFEKSLKKNKTNVISVVDETGKELLKEYKKSW